MSTFLWIVTACVAGLGTLLTLVAALGVLRLPDLMMRMHASTKSATLGVVLVLAGVALRFRDPEVAVRSVLIILFLFATAPVAAQVIARAAYRAGVPLADETVLDEMREYRGAETDPER